MEKLEPSTNGQMQQKFSDIQISGKLGQLCAVYPNSGFLQEIYVSFDSAPRFQEFLDQWEAPQVFMIFFYHTNIIILTLRINQFLIVLNSSMSKQ